MTSPKGLRTPEGDVGTRQYTKHSLTTTQLLLFKQLPVRRAYPIDEYIVADEGALLCRRLREGWRRGDKVRRRADCGPGGGDGLQLLRGGRQSRP